MIAFGADRQVVLPFLEENHLSAISAFMPEIVACRFLLGNEGNDLSDAVNPAHTAASFARSEEHTSELQSLMRISYAVFCLKKKNSINKIHTRHCQTHCTNRYGHTT